MVNLVDWISQTKALGIDPVAATITALDEIFKWEKEKQEELKGYLIAENFKYHYENNEYYRNICKCNNVSPDDIQSFEDINKIPLIPVGQFKQTDSHLLLSKPLSEIEFEMRSTGTSGIPSLSRRDSFTIDRCLFGVYAMYRNFFKFSRGAGLFLFPSPEEMPEMGMVKVLNMFSGLFDATKCLVKRATFKPQAAIEVLESWEGRHTRHIIGPPFLVYRLIKYLKNNNIHLNLDKHSKVINLGGWKRFTGMEIPRDEYNRECSEYFGIEENNVRDMYGLVEANGLAIECEHHNKHVPPWMHFSIRDPKDLTKEVAPGRRGVLVIFDPTSYSYPAFIQTEDLVYLKEKHSCLCGRQSQQVVYLARVKGAEIGCCAINLEKHMDEVEKKQQMEQVHN
ncbi:LuxE family acyl-protein synthetase [Geobacillus sp. C56-T2]|uniref:LuxE/PaaK family acyltransferase n=1 Tax=Geobacillus sp. C56-T2 TaxID=600773 RepID=UPI0011A0484E|nr:LuxE family acyl-protein synthetase [Geobacillus sp. C56-T2]NNV07441.1 LuxE family acyl-protein synthetase [Geobacillus sp. MMMUD3]TWG29299.1 long-chain-fatty-acid---luciferin-component ligase [Geobacillus sp. C56-T2]